MKDTCESAIVKAYNNLPKGSTWWLAVHELGRRIRNHSQNSIATKLSQMALLGRVEGRVRDGKRFKEWRFIS